MIPELYIFSFSYTFLSFWSTEWINMHKGFGTDWTIYSELKTNIGIFEVEIWDIYPRDPNIANYFWNFSKVFSGTTLVDVTEASLFISRI